MEVPFIVEAGEQTYAARITRDGVYHAACRNDPRAEIARIGRVGRVRSIGDTSARLRAFNESLKEGAV
jgi:hypothetical protein